MAITLNLPTNRRSGFTLSGLICWAIAIGLFVLPFLREQTRPDWEAPDPTRKLEYTDDEDESGLDLPFWDEVDEIDGIARDEEWDFEQPLRAFVEEATSTRFGVDSQELAASGLVETARLERGEYQYTKHCGGCHGISGDGAGPAARYLSPRPRNLRKGLFKFKSTESGSRPRRADLYKVVSRGLAGSAMPYFSLLPEETRWDVVEWVRYLSIKGEFEQMLLDLSYEDEELPDADEVYEIVARRWDSEELRAQFPNVSETPRDQASIDRGRALFNDTSKATCFSCHGPTGRGDGPTADAYRDGWGYPIRPRDLSAGVFRAGSEGKDLWLTIANGIGGTPMPAYAGALTGEEIWDLVHFVEFLASPTNQER